MTPPAPAAVIANGGTGDTALVVVRTVGLTTGGTTPIWTLQRTDLLFFSQTFDLSPTSTITLNSNEYWTFVVPAPRAGGGTYSFACKVTDATGASPYSSSSQNIRIDNGWKYQLDGSTTTPPKISSVTADASGNPVVKWSSVPNAQSYMVQWAQAKIDANFGQPSPPAESDWKDAFSTTTTEWKGGSWYSSDTSYWTYFRVYARHAQLGNTLPGAGVGMRNPQRTTSTTNFGNGSGTSTTASGSTAAGTVDLTPTVMSGDSSVKFEVNLPLIKYGVGTAVSSVGSGPASSNRLPDYVSKLWRHGMIVMNANQPAAEAPPGEKDGSGTSYRRYGFVFHYNPASWTQSVAMATDIDLTTLQQTQIAGSFLPLPTSLATISFTLYLNRVLESSLIDTPYGNEGLFPADVLDAEGRAAGSSIDSYYSSALDRNNLTGSPAGAAAVALNFNKKFHAVVKKGTLGDLEYLYRTLGGSPSEVTHTHADDPYPWTSDIGLLPMRLVDVHLGDSIRYNGRITGVSINHQIFNHRMVPTFTEVGITMVRGLSLKSSPSSYDPFAAYSATTSAAATTPAATAATTTVG